MKKQLVKVIKRADGESKPPPVNREKKRKKRSLESTVQGWVTERRENEDTEDRSRNAQLASWNAESTPSETV